MLYRANKKKNQSLAEKNYSAWKIETYKTPSDLQVKISENAVINIELVRLSLREWPTKLVVVQLGLNSS